MEIINKTGTPMYYIETYNKKNQLVDISEEGYPTNELCLAAIEAERIQDVEFEKEIMEEYEEQLKNFIFDMDTTDRPPLNPLSIIPRYEKKPHLYILDENGSYNEVDEPFIKGIEMLDVTKEQLDTIKGLITRTIDPKTFSDVRSWIARCYHEPTNADELIMCALNQVLEGYGIEAIRTSKWKNGYWMDILATYVNMGDSYTATILHHRKYGFIVSTVGDLAEKNKHII